MPGDRPRFSELLVDRRRRLGLSLNQASQVLRLKPQVLLAFEEGDFEQMPKSGYAQGMLASYARYLGLNPKQVADQYAADLDAYLRSGGGRRFDHGTVVTREVSPGGVGAPTPRYEGARGLLPTSGGLAGDYGAFATTTTVRRNGSTDADLRYSSHRDDTTGDFPYAADVDERSGFATRRYTTRTPSRASRARGTRTTSRPTQDRGYAPGRSQRGHDRDRVTTRQVGRGEYVDDLRYENARPYEAASTASGRVRSRDIASTRRPNVQRRRPQGSTSDVRHGGVLGVVEAFFSDPRRAVVAIVAIAAVVLTMFIVSSIRGCIANQSSTGRMVEVTQTDATSSDEQEQGNDSKAADEQALADAAAARQQRVVPAETIVKVSVADGMVSWVEIQSDGESVLAETITGPWEQTFTVASSITIGVSDPSSVSVTENGELRQFDNRTSGIGTITIENAAKVAAEAAGATIEGADGDATTDDALDADGDDMDDSYVTQDY